MNLKNVFRPSKGILYLKVTSKLPQMVCLSKKKKNNKKQSGANKLLESCIDSQQIEGVWKPLCFYANVVKGDNFYDFMSASMGNEILPIKERFYDFIPGSEGTK